MHLVMLLALFAGSEQSELDELIGRLHHPRHSVRHEATVVLRQKLNPETIKRLKAESETNKSLETRYRCKNLVAAHYRIADIEGIPSIWYLPKSTRFNEAGDDLAKEYFQKARENLGDAQICGWRDTDVCPQATRLLFMEMLDDPKRFDKVRELRKSMKDLEKEEEKVYSSVAFAEDGFYDLERPPPPAIEDWIEAGRKNQNNYVPIEPVITPE